MSETIIPLVSLKKSMKLNDIRFPVYVVHTDDVLTRDGLLWCDGKVIDDKNIEGKSLGERRLRSPIKHLYDLKYQIDDFGGLVKHRGRFYVDSNGKFFIYEKSKSAKLKYHLIGKLEHKDVATLMWIQGIPFPFELPRPPAMTMRYAGILYIDDKPSFVYDFSETLQKDSWRKI
jgi:hypothetical protein